MDVYINIYIVQKVNIVCVVNIILCALCMYDCMHL